MMKEVCCSELRLDLLYESKTTKYLRGRFVHLLPARLIPSIIPREGICALTDPVGYKCASAKRKAGPAEESHADHAGHGWQP